MTPKEKAEKLVGEYYFQVQTLEQQKQCALIAVDEILKSIVWHHDFSNQKRNYWQEVKQEIENL